MQGLFALLLGCSVLGLASWVSLAAADELPSSEPPQHLADTGLYSDFASGTIRADNLPYTPQYPLWSDGAVKRRWIHLPAGTSIDGTNPDAWEFPIGTRLWKEFSFGERVETRYMERASDGSWSYATYVWNPSGSDAVRAPDEGVRAACKTPRHDIPSAIDCRACHEGRATPVLGFSALQLSTDRDPLAPHAETPAPDTLDLKRLVERGLLRGADSLATNAPRIEASTPRGRAALGYLHANCGGCHNANGPLAALELELDYPLAPSREELPPALRTTLDRPSRFHPTGQVDCVRIAPGVPEHSVIVERMSSRFAALQMPPLGTHAIDQEATKLVSDWIRNDLAAPSTVADQNRTHLTSRHR